MLTVKFWTPWPLFVNLLVSMFSPYIPCNICIANLQRIILSVTTFTNKKGFSKTKVADI